MGSAEFTDWMAYDRLEPVGPRADRYLLAAVAALLANLREPRRRQAYQPEDFMPGILSARPEPTQREVVTKGRAIFSAIAAGQAARKRGKA